MEYIKGNTYLVTCNKPVVIKTKASMDGVDVTTYPPGHKIDCISYTHDEHNNTWLRVNLGWVMATHGEDIFIQ